MSILIIEPDAYMKKSVYDADGNAIVEKTEGVRAVEELPASGQEGEIIYNKTDGYFYIRITE